MPLAFVCKKGHARLPDAEVGEVGDRTFFSMEWLAGGDLAGRLCGGPLPPPEAVLLVVKFSDAFHVAHL